MIILFEDYKLPDLRKISSWTLCIKNYNIKFTKGHSYKVVGIYGDPQSAIEKYGIESYIPIVCIKTIVVLNNNNNKEYMSIDDFLNYFDIPEYMNDIEKFNI